MISTVNHIYRKSFQLIDAGGTIKNWLLVLILILGYKFFFLVLKKVALIISRKNKILLGWFRRLENT